MGKERERTGIKNYRSVSILNCFSKVYERFIPAFEIQVLSHTSAIKCRGKFKIFQFASAMLQQKKTTKKLPDLAETFKALSHQ